MISLPTLVAAAALCGLAAAVARADGAAAARRRAAGGIAVALATLAAAEGLVAAWVPDHVLQVGGLAVDLLRGGWHAAAPFVYLLVGLLGTALAPAASHPPAVLAAIVQLVAVSLACLSFDHPAALLLAWAASIAVFARGLGGGPLRRVLLRYQIPSLVCAAAGTAAVLAGQRELGALGWLLAIVSREAILPLHGWLPALAARAPLGLLVAFCGPQLGVYAHLVVVHGALPAGQAHAFAGLGAATALLGAAIGLVQQDARRAVAWLILSQTGLVAFGLANQSGVGLTGAVLTWQVSAIALSGFAMTVAALEARRGSLSLREPGGSFARTPRMAVAFLVLGFASVGLPLTLGFVAEDLLVQGSIDEFPLLGLVLVLATAGNGMNVMRCFFTLFSGRQDHLGEPDLTPRERAALTLALVVLLAGGAAPRLFVHGPADPEAHQSSR